jgi:hypothetical protein
VSILFSSTISSEVDFSVELKEDVYLQPDTLTEVKENFEFHITRFNRGDHGRRAV